jgi:hypothetical protein
MVRKSCAQFLRSRLMFLSLPMMLAVLVGLSACDNNNAQPDRQYCDSSGCYACNGGNCYPVPGQPTKPSPPGMTTTCDNDAACGTGQLCNLGTCTPSCSADSNCSSGQSCISGRCRPSGSAQCGIAGAECAAESSTCSASQTCVSGNCATLCPQGSCALGQICNSGACVEDPSPKSPQCVFDTDCPGTKGGFRCVNAYCLSTCTDSSTCVGGASCLQGLCRGSR